MFKPFSYKNNHPNPIFYREDFELLNGEWDFAFDYKNKGEKLDYQNKLINPIKINVPYSYLSKNSGINIKKRCDNVWYHKDIKIDSLDKLVILHLEGSDYKTLIYCNGTLVKISTGGYHRISADITNFLHIGINNITIKCEDDMSLSKPRGKQRFLKKNFMCWYEETTGIYKDVWIERVNKEHVSYYKATPSFKNKNVILKVEPDGTKYTISYKGSVVKEGIVKGITTVDLSDNFHPWDVLKPELYDIKLEYKNDTVYSYFGIRDVYTVDNKVYLNDHELYQKLILDQGYIEDGDLTLTAKELEEDIKATINFGFNGARKHQKRETDIYYALADFYGLLVYAEMPSMYVLNKKSKSRFTSEWFKIVDELYNHPSIICYTPFNESWGVFGIDKFKKKACDYVNFIYDMTKKLDNTRLCQTNDGWSHTKSDLVTIHNYSQKKEELKKVINDAITKNYVPFLNGRKLYQGSIPNKPILVSEFGGVSRYFKDNKSWGYSKNITDNNEYYNNLKDLFDAIKEDKRIVGYCYTQLSDVRQEMNGLLTMDRIKKISDEEMKKING